MRLRETGWVLWEADAVRVRSANGLERINACKRKGKEAELGRKCVRQRCRPVKVYQPKEELQSKDCLLE